MDTAGLFLSDRTKEAEKTAPSGPTQTRPSAVRTHPSAAQIWGSDGSARTRADRARVLPWSTCHLPASVRLLQCDAFARVSASRRLESEPRRLKSERVRFGRPAITFNASRGINAGVACRLGCRSVAFMAAAGRSATGPFKRRPQRSRGHHSLHRHSHRSRQSHHIPATIAQPWGSGRRAGTTTRPAGLGAGCHLDAGLHRAAPGWSRRSHQHASVIAGTFR
jgi:hypothetical protein